MACNTNLRYIGGVIGVADTLYANNIYTNNISLIAKHVGNGEIVGFATGGLVGRVNKTEVYNCSF